MSALRTKLLRDLGGLKGSILTIAVVVAAGIAAYVCLAGTYRSLHRARTSYYIQNRMGDVFATARRAPRTLHTRIELIPGVERVHTRVQAPLRVPLGGDVTPASGVAVSLPRSGQPPLGALRMVEGRLPRAGHDEEAVLLEAFAESHELRAGDRLRVVLEGRERNLRIVGVANAPEYVFSMQPGALAPEPDRFAVLWMSRDALSAALDMRGAFNDVVLTLQHGASRAEVISRLDTLLEPYGGSGAIGRDRQMSDYFLNQELGQLEGMATSTPLIFLAVAAFLLNVVLARIISLQRAQIATLKAVGYTDLEVGLHYLTLVFLIVGIGAAFGLALGAYLGRGMTGLYTQYFRLPALAYRMPADLAASALMISLFAGLAGALSSVRQVIKLPPAEAMRPEPPPAYSRSPWLAPLRALFNRLIGPSSRMVLREVRRRPLRLVFSVVGIAMSLGIVLVGQSFSDSMGYLMRVYFEGVQREDVTVAFADTVPESALATFRRLPGVYRVEGVRSLPVRLESSHRSRRAGIMGYAPGHDLRLVRDTRGERVEVPDEGVMLTTTLADILQVRVGDTVRAVPLVGPRRALRLPVTALVNEPMGLAGHMRTSNLHQLLRQAPGVDMALLQMDPGAFAHARGRIEAMPSVVSISRKRDLMERFDEQSATMMRAFAIIISLFAAVITIGVVYNNARVSLSARKRDLGSLRVLGFTRQEISSVLLGELALQVLLAIPLGMVLGYGMVTATLSNTDLEAYRLPTVLSAASYASAALVTLVAAMVSALIVRRRLDHINLIDVLKTRD